MSGHTNDIKKTVTVREFSHLQTKKTSMCDNKLAPTFTVGHAFRD